jgi:hypothetical protein
MDKIDAEEIAMNKIILLTIICFFVLSACSASAAQDCENSNIGVRYVITGDKVGVVSITQSSDTGGMELGDFAVPYCRIMSGFEEGDPLYISVRIHGDSGTVTCKIYDEEKIVSQSSARAHQGGFAAIATCSATK